MNPNIDVLENSIQKTNELLKKIEADLEWEDRKNQAYQALRVVLHALRDRMTVEDAVHLSAQLPLFIKGVFFDGWKPNEVPIKMNRAEFVQRVAREFRLDVEGGIEIVIQVVLNDLFDTVDPAEKIKVMDTLPRDIAELFM